MNILVYNVAADNSGALTILKDFYSYVRNHPDTSINWYFVLSVPQLEETENIKVIKYPWVKRSWFHRYFFDNFVAPKLIDKYKIDAVFSMQNIMMPKIKVRQVVYLHQCIPFVKHKFKFTENKLFWIYQNIISKNIYNSLENANITIVQTHWMKRACMERTAAIDESIVVVPPQISIKTQQKYCDNNSNRKTFFYPATAFGYKNHMIILKACELLHKEGISDYRVIFTLTGQENDYAKQLFEFAKFKSLNISFEGPMDRKEVFEMYTRSVLLFPSYLETFGLPLLEARIHESFILASDCDFSHEVLAGYANAYFFNEFKERQLAGLMKDVYNGKLHYKYVNSETEDKEQSGWDLVFNKLIDIKC